MKKQNWFALLLSIFQPGLGHLYLGKLKFGGVLILLTSSLLIFTGSQNAYMVLGPIAFKIIAIIFAAVRCLFIKRKVIEGSLGYLQNWFICFVIFIALQVLNSNLNTNAYIRFSTLTGSMEPTMVTGESNIGHYIDSKNIQRGDIIFFNMTKSKKRIVKRVIGVPGDLVEVKDGKVFVNDKELIQTKVSEASKIIALMSPEFQETQLEIFNETLNGKTYQVAYSKSKPANRNVARIEVPASKYFVIGDNRDFSTDSRSWKMIPKENIFGKASFVLMPLGSENLMGRFNKALE